MIVKRKKEKKKVNKKFIKNGAEIVDVLVVSIHFGNEYQKEPSSRQKRLAREAINA